MSKMKYITNPLLLLILAIPTKIYHFIIFLRNFFYDKNILKSYQCETQLISVGNLTLGGTGKTPLVAHLSKYYLYHGKKVAIVSRGYKGTKSTKKVFIISDGKGRIFGNAEECGDEPFLLATWLPEIPILISKKRALAVERARTQFSPDIIILDDAYQHRAVSRDLDILIVDAMDPFGNYRLPPSGILREPIQNIKRADIIIINRAEKDDDFITLKRILRRHNEKASIFKSGNIITEIVRMGSGPSLKPMEINGLSCYIFCAIGNPDAFSLNLEKLGAHIVGNKFFRDHHQYTINDLRKIDAEAKRKEASIILTTQKDMVRVQNVHLFSLPIYYASMELVLYEENRFFQALDKYFQQPCPE